MIECKNYTVVPDGAFLFKIKLDGSGALPISFRGSWTKAVLAQEVIDNYFLDKGVKDGSKKGNNRG